MKNRLSWVRLGSGVALIGLLFVGVAAADGLPPLDAAGLAGYREFLAAPGHRAFAIAAGGGWAWKAGEGSAQAAGELALSACETDSGQTCVLYALEGRQVWDAARWATLWQPYPAVAKPARVGTARGEVFYNLAFKTPAGKALTLADFRGKVVLLHFWGAWCPSCQRELPDLQKLTQALAWARDIQVVLLQVREPFADSQRWVQQRGLSLPLYDSGLQAGQLERLRLADGQVVADRVLAPAFPSSYVLDKRGVVVFAHVGPVPAWPQYLPLLRDVAAKSGR